MSNDKITDEQIEQLQSEAIAAGDHAQTAICSVALEGDRHARAECARFIRDARDEADYQAALEASDDGS